MEEKAGGVVKATPALGKTAPTSESPNRSHRMSIASTAPDSSKPRRRGSRRSSASKTERPLEKVKIGLCLSADAAKRLAVHAAMEGLDRSEIVETLINEYLRKYRVQTIGPDLADPANSGGSGLVGESAD